MQSGRPPKSLVDFKDAVSNVTFYGYEMYLIVQSLKTSDKFRNKKNILFTFLLINLLVVF